MDLHPGAFAGDFRKYLQSAFNREPAKHVRAA